MRPSRLHDVTRGQRAPRARSPSRPAPAPNPQTPPCPPPHQALGLAVNRGPLTMQDWSFGQLALLYAVPIYPTERALAAGGAKKGRLGDSAGRGPQLMARFVAQTGGCARACVFAGERLGAAARRTARAAAERPPSRPTRPSPSTPLKRSAVCRGGAASHPFPAAGGAALLRCAQASPCVAWTACALCFVPWPACLGGLRFVFTLAKRAARSTGPGGAVAGRLPSEARRRSF